MVRISFKDIFQNISLSWWLRISYNLSEMVPSFPYIFNICFTISESILSDHKQYSFPSVQHNLYIHDDFHGEWYRHKRRSPGWTLSHAICNTAGNLCESLAVCCHGNRHEILLWNSAGRWPVENPVTRSPTLHYRDDVCDTLKCDNTSVCEKHAKCENWRHIYEK